MEIISSVWNWLNTNSGALSVVLVLIPMAWAVFTYLSVKKQELRERRFRAYHQLVKDLVERQHPDRPMKLDRQIAIIYELRNFREYFQVSLRILKGLKETWTESGPDVKRDRLHEEIDLAIKYIENKL